MFFRPRRRMLSACRTQSSTESASTTPWQATDRRSCSSAAPASLPTCGSPRWPTWPQPGTPSSPSTTEAAGVPKRRPGLGHGAPLLAADRVNPVVAEFLGTGQGVGRTGSLQG